MSIAEDEGNKVAELTPNVDLEDCHRICDENPYCHSHSWCPEYNNICYLFDKKLTKTDPAKYNGYCQSYYKHAKGSIAKHRI